MGSSLTKDLGRFASGALYADLSPAMRKTIRAGFADCVGVMLAGADEPPTVLLKDVLHPTGGEATLLFRANEKASALDAAFINATAAHVLDLDDVAMRGHPSAVLVPAIMAEAEAINASGSAMVLAYAVGYEIWGELMYRDRDAHHEKGWHPTAIFGPIAAAAACASLMRLSPEQAGYAISMGASQSSGLTANFGTMTKPMHAGRAAHAGVLSARLAARDFTAALDVFENPLGFLTAVSKSGRLDLERPVQVGSKWRLETEGITFKKYALCFAAHGAMDGLLDLASKNGIKAEDVEQVCVTINKRHGGLLRYHAPKTGLEAKFSMEFAMACGLITHSAGISELQDAFVQRQDIQDLMKKVTVLLEDEDPAHPGFSLNDHVIIRTKDGKEFKTGRLMSIRGGPQSPLSDEELWMKFKGCAMPHIPVEKARILFDALMNIEQLDSPRHLPFI